MNPSPTASARVTKGRLVTDFSTATASVPPTSRTFVHCFLALLSRVVQGLLALLPGICNHALDVCLDVAKRRRAFGGEIILRGIGRRRSPRGVVRVARSFGA